MTISAQSRWGIRTGLNYDLNTIGLSDAAGSTQAILEGETADNGYHIGVFGRQFLGDQLYTSGSLIFAKNTHFLEGYDASGNIVFGQFNHEFIQLDADLGIRLLKLVRAEAGVHYQGMLSDNAFNQTFESPSVGYNVGVGIDLWKLSLDVTYYSSFQDHIGDWNNIPLSYNRSQLLISLGVKL
ncbi:MAG: hypothetical protein CMP53_06595 [Flavobacteriales bacterium]|nr:hypothetical protein [Flavobacteriales bacterium]